MNADDPTADPAALQEALAAVLAPLARLAVARGLPCAAVEEWLREAFVQAASDAHPGLLPHRRVSRISTVTGINRREVTRLVQQAPAARPRGRSLVAEVLACWLSDPAYREPQGAPRVLPRQGPRPSFETLAQDVTRDVHPRSLLDEMLRLGLATLDEAADAVRAASAVPKGDSARMLRVLGNNVGDHLRAAAANVVDGQGRHFEQAVFADGLSDATMGWLRDEVRRHWQGLLADLVPELKRRIDADGQAEPPPTRHWRLGLYSYDDGAAPAPNPDTLPAPRRPRTRKAKP